MIQHPLRTTGLMVLAAASLATTGCQAQDGRTGDDHALHLVHASEFGASFVVGSAPSAIPGEPVEIQVWRFSDKQDELTRSWGWDSSWSRERIDCQAGTRQAQLQRTYLNGEQVQEVTPNSEPRAPVGQDHRAEQDYVCNPQRAAAETTLAATTLATTTLATPEAARAWSDAHFDRVRTPPRR